MSPNPMTSCSRGLILLSLLLVSTYESRSEVGALSISLGADVLAPLGKLRSEVLTGYGGSAKFNLLLSRRFALASSVGFMSFQGKLDSLASIRGVPVRVGLKFYAIRSVAMDLYLSGEAGIFFPTDKQERAVGLSAAPILGFELPMGTGTCFDLSLRYDHIDFSGRKRATLGVRAAATFQL